MYHEQKRLNVLFFPLYVFIFLGYTFIKRVRLLFFVVNALNEYRVQSTVYKGETYTRHENGFLMA